MDELTPVVKQLTSYPIAFLGGFFSGLLRLNLADEPVKNWLEQHSGGSYTPPSSPSSNGHGGPQTISID